MDKLIIPVVVCIILVGIGFYMFNNPNGINTGITNGAERINEKTTDFNYFGDVAPGAGQTLPTGN